MTPPTKVKFDGQVYVLAEQPKPEAPPPEPQPKTAAVISVDRIGGDNETPGKLVQYYTNGPGFTPTTTTIATLPPGVYDITSVNRQPTLVPHPVVTDSLLRLPDSKSEEVIAEIEKFWTLKQKFAEHGYVNKRGFLLWGPPGSGKTATIATVSKQVVLDGGLVLLAQAHPRTVASILADIRQIEPDRRITCVVEDIDATVSIYGETDTLALLDGEYSVDNIVFIASTNYPEKLDKRLINRPSRFDKVVNIGMPNAASRRMYLESRNLHLADADMDKWVEATDGMSIAHLKELIVSVKCFDNSFDETITRLRKMGTELPNSAEYESPEESPRLRHKHVEYEEAAVKVASVEQPDLHQAHVEVGRRGRGMPAH